MTARKPRTLLAMTEDTARELFTPAAASRLAALADLAAAPWTGQFAPAALSDVEILITAWGVPPLTAAVLATAPRLEAVFHVGGTLRSFCTDACWERGLTIVTAAEANAIPVAEFTLASILYAGKRVLAASHAYRASHANGWRDAGLLATASNLGRTVGLVGLSRVGRRVAGLLEPFDLTVIATDPFAEPGSTRAELVPLEDLLRRSDIVSLHAPLLPQTRNMLDAKRLSMMRDGATLINTARGGLVDTAALSRELQSGRIHAILDVTEPEPLPASSPLFHLPNVQLTPHLAGSTGSEVTRMGDLIVDELTAYACGRPLRHQVVREELDRVA